MRRFACADGGYLGGTIRPSARFFLALLSIVICLACASVSYAEPTIIQVEEDWELVVRDPSPSRGGPQVTCVISPYSDTDTVHATFEINHRTQPDYAPGGLQVQLWKGESVASVHTSPKGNTLATPGETVRWTQTMRLNHQQLVFEVVGGSSKTWESFGGEGYLKVSGVTHTPSLNGYNPAVSAAHSGVGFASNRVGHLVLKEVRWFSKDGLVHRSTAPIVVFDHQ